MKNTTMTRSQMQANAMRIESLLRAADALGIDSPEDQEVIVNLISLAIRKAARLNAALDVAAGGIPSEKPEGAL